MVEAAGKGTMLTGESSKTCTSRGDTEMNQPCELEENLVRQLKGRHHDADTSGFGILDFASAFGSPLYALVYSKLFWPDFIHFEGMIFHSSIMENDEDRARVRAAPLRGESRLEVEQSFNSFDIPSDFFASGSATTTREEDIWLTRQLADMWRWRLKETFPERRFTVEVEEPADEEPTLRFWQQEGT
jgi:hypothetical protein